ncbi:MAG: hypothetical protein HXX20_17410 [Chloroflexi bacterium]|nr:hypothetical protein [Chloroflexota bacterium]
MQKMVADDSTSDTPQPTPLEYQHPNVTSSLSRADFDVLLQHHQLELAPELADHFYYTLQENCSLHSLRLKHTVSPEAYGMAAPSADWQTVIKPILGLLLVACEPLEYHHLSHLIQTARYVEEATLTEGLQKLGSLVATDGQGRYYLYHQKLAEFLHSPETASPEEEQRAIFTREEEKNYHLRLAKWCEEGKGGIAAIWQEERRGGLEQIWQTYARRHYVTHLYHAQAYDKLFAVLDEGSYGQSKLRHNVTSSLSTCTYALDLELGRKAASRIGTTEGIGLLPNLWRYSLLRCSLNSQADNYPDAWFEVMVLVGRQQEALGLAELLTKPKKKAEVLRRIALAGQFDVTNSVTNSLLGAEAEHQKHRLTVLLQRMGELTPQISAGREVREERAQDLVEAVQALLKTAQYTQALEIAAQVGERPLKVKILVEIAQALLKAAQYTQALEIATQIEDYAWQVQVRVEIALAMVEAGVEDPTYVNALQLLAEGTAVTFPVESNWEQARVLSSLAQTLVGAGEYAQAQKVASQIKDKYWRAKILVEIAEVLVAAEEKKRAEVIKATTIQTNFMVWAAFPSSQEFAQLEHAPIKQSLFAEAQIVARQIEDSWEKAHVFGELAQVLVSAGERKKALVVLTEAQAVAHQVEDRSKKAWVLVEVAKAWLAAEEKLDGFALLEETQVLASQIDDSLERAKILVEAARTLVSAREKAKARKLWTEVQRVASQIGAASLRAQVLVEVAKIMIGNRSAEQEQSRVEALSLLAEAQAVASQIEASSLRARILGEVGQALVMAGEYTRAQDLARQIEASWARAGLLVELARAFVSIGEYNQAQEIARQIEDDSERAWVLVDLAQALISAGEKSAAAVVLDEAKAVAEEIEDDSERAGVLVEVARALLGLGQAPEEEMLAALTLLAEVQTLAQQIEDSSLKARVLVDLAKAMVEAKTISGSISQALEIVHLISASREDNSLRTIALNEVVKALTKAGENEQALRVVQQEWQQAATREEATQLLALAYPLIPLQPEIGVAFAEAFDWVDRLVTSSLTTSGNQLTRPAEMGLVDKVSRFL